MKYTKQPKRYLCLSDFEWKALVKGINEYRKQVIDEDGCVEAINELVRVEITDLTKPQIKPSVSAPARIFLPSIRSE